MSLSLSPAERADMLFRALHGTHTDEPTVEQVTEALRSRGIEVEATALADIRSGRDAAPAPDLLAAIAEHFHQAPWYLTDAGDTDRVVALHTQLELLLALRDSGVNHVRLRGKPTSSDRRALIRSLEARQRNRRWSRRESFRRNPSGFRVIVSFTFSR